jgi:putative DNA methylase
MSNPNYRKKLIGVALPLEVINIASQKETNPFLKYHPRQIHFWWARRPLAACRAMVFASMIDDPSAWPELFPSNEMQEVERHPLAEQITENFEKLEI